MGTRTRTLQTHNNATRHAHSTQHGGDKLFPDATSKSGNRKQHNDRRVGSWAEGAKAGERIREGAAGRSPMFWDVGLDAGRIVWFVDAKAAENGPQ
jgi:hypothetical protein